MTPETKIPMNSDISSHDVAETAVGLSKNPTSTWATAVRKVRGKFTKWNDAPKGKTDTSTYTENR
jgi:hypothetical protein